DSGSYSDSSSICTDCLSHGFSLIFPRHVGPILPKGMVERPKRKVRSNLDPPRVESLSLASFTYHLREKHPFQFKSFIPSVGVPTKSLTNYVKKAPALILPSPNPSRFLCSDSCCCV